MLFETTRLIIRSWTPDDAADAFAIYRDPKVTRFLGGTIPHSDLTYTRGWIARQLGRTATYPPGLGFWAAQHRETGRVIGAAALMPSPDNTGIEVGYHLGRDWWGQGYATEIAAGCLDYGFARLALPRIIAVVMPENIESRRVLEKLGLRYEGRRQYLAFVVDSFAIVAADWAATHPTAGPDVAP